MVLDNEWHFGFLVQRTDGQFTIYEQLDDLRDNPDLPKGEIKYEKVRYNWNHGQPKIEGELFQATIMDLDPITPTNSTPTP